MSSDGTKQSAVAYNTTIYISTDSGVTWTSNGPSQKWISIAMSSDGVYQTAIVENSYIYINNQSGL
jgi:hypothetical protein